jgi:Asp-tRNA(Asn)/Glu-tRNA(Gln) amidotransferase B subunit
VLIFGKRAHSITCPVCLGLPELSRFQQFAVKKNSDFGNSPGCTLNQNSKLIESTIFIPILPKVPNLNIKVPLCREVNELISGHVAEIERILLEEDVANLFMKKIERCLILTNQECPLLKL